MMGDSTLAQRAVLARRSAEPGVNNRIKNSKFMEPSLYRYILNHSKKDQIGLIILSLATLPLVYITLE